MEFSGVWKAVHVYCEQHSEVEPDYLVQLNRETHLHTLSPQMLSGALQGRFLSFMSRILQPKCILEIGTFTGYAAICLAEGLRKEGELHTIELNAEYKRFHDNYFPRALHGNQIKVYYGDAKTIIPSLNTSFDLIFIDADKPAYPEYFQLLQQYTHSGSVIIGDNVLWSNKVLTNDTDKDTIALKTFSHTVAQHPDWTSVMLPLRDGLMIARKK